MGWESHLHVEGRLSKQLRETGFNLSPKQKVRHILAILCHAVMLGAQCQQQRGRHSGAVRAVGRTSRWAVRGFPLSPALQRGPPPLQTRGQEQSQPAQSCLKFLPQGGSFPFQTVLYTVKQQKENEVFGDFFHFGYEQ